MFFLFLTKFTFSKKKNIPVEHHECILIRKCQIYCLHLFLAYSPHWIGSVFAFRWMNNNIFCDKGFLTLINVLFMRMNLMEVNAESREIILKYVWIFIVFWTIYSGSRDRVEETLIIDTHTKIFIWYRRSRRRTFLHPKLSAPSCIEKVTNPICENWGSFFWEECSTSRIR